MKWVGMVGYDVYSAEEQELIKSEAEKYDAYPVFPDEQTLKNTTYYYDSVITPIFHNFAAYWNNANVRKVELFQSYRSMNKDFVKVIVPIYKKYPKAIILFNDPYFLLAPRLVHEALLSPREVFPETPHMGYFFHVPFSSYEVYRVFPAAQEFLESLLCCDIVAFQVYEYARHFFTCCHRLLGLEAESRHRGMIGIIYKGRDVVIRVVHSGVSKQYTEELRKTKEYRLELEAVKKLAKNRLIICSVDKLSPISGIKNKLIAYRNLLKEHPSHIDKIVLIQYCTPGIKSNITKETSKEIKKLVAEFNIEFKNSIIYSKGSVSNEKRLALFTAAEILLITSLRDGFCLLPFEFLLGKNALQKDREGGSSTGSVILSEFAGCASAMSSICRVNPYSTSEIAYSILQALETQKTIGHYTGFLHDVKYIETHDVSNWLQSIVKDSKRGHNKNEAALYLGAIDDKILKAEVFFEHLVASDLKDHYVKAVNRVILLDTEGTIMPIMPLLIDRASHKLRQLLASLCADERNTVFILSGKPKSLIDHWFGCVAKLGLAAEYGYHYRSNAEREWKVTPIHSNDSWKAKVKDIFLWYKDRTDGSYLEIKDGSIVWVYKECDPELGNWQAKELEKALKAILTEYPSITSIHGRGFVEAKLKTLEKGESAMLILDEVHKRKGNVDFVLAIGDDTSDEPMFRTINAINKEKQAGKLDKDSVLFTCTIGRKPSYARYYVNDYKEAVALLKVLERYSIKIPRNKSADNLLGANIQAEGTNLLASPFTLKGKANVVIKEES
eukprot:TRINITY_DN1500_c0_g1_i3.p1 TRINITY_DN1500_c0_g1~~TRINITY_DN1500_c0_g1_i3.p1  ORF type:complete len:784 (-),score=250.70 TRINITY_DN1500_c0_g1_i3:158-2509(-)